MDNATNRGVLTWRPKCTYLCTKYASHIFLLGAEYVCVWDEQCQQLWGLDVVPQMRIPLHQMCQKPFFWMPSMGVFEMHNANNCGVLTWRPECTYLCTKYASRAFFGYLILVCLWCTMPTVLGFYCGAPNAHTSAPILRATLFFDTYYGCV